MNILRALAVLVLVCGSDTLLLDDVSAQEISFDQINRFESLGTGTLRVGASRQKRLSIMVSGTGASRSIPECLLFGAPIEPDDAVLLCVHFQPKSDRREESSPLRSVERTHD